MNKDDLHNFFPICKKENHIYYNFDVTHAYLIIRRTSEFGFTIFKFVSQSLGHNWEFFLIWINYEANELSTATKPTVVRLCKCLPLGGFKHGMPHCLKNRNSMKFGKTIKIFSLTVIQTTNELWTFKLDRKSI